MVIFALVLIASEFVIGVAPFLGEGRPVDF